MCITEVEMKRFQIITEVEARVLDIGSTVELIRGGRVTPLARDTLKMRRVTVRDSVDATSSEMRGPSVSDYVRTLAVGADHSGVTLKTELIRYLRSQGRTAHDLGAFDARDEVDCLDVAATVALAVARGEVEAGIVIDQTGIGSAISANKIKGVRAAMVQNEQLATCAQQNNDVNVLALGASLINVEQARAIVDAWLAVGLRGSNYHRRLEKLSRLEKS